MPFLCSWQSTLYNRCVVYSFGERVHGGATEKFETDKCVVPGNVVCLLVFSNRWVQRSGLSNIVAHVWRNQSNFYRNVRLFLTEKKLKLNNIEHLIANVIQNLNRFFIHYFGVFEPKPFSETSRKIVGFTAYSFVKHLEIIMWHICTVYTDSPLISFSLSYCKCTVVAVFAKNTDIISFL